MRLNDVFTEELNEAPAGVFKQLSTAAKAINPFSMSGQARARGEQDTQRLANQMYSEYHKWAGARGEKVDTQKTVHDFLIQRGFSKQVAADAMSKLVAAPRTAGGVPAGVDKKSLDQAFLSAAQTYVKTFKPKKTRKPSGSPMGAPAAAPIDTTPSTAITPSSPSPTITKDSVVQFYMSLSAADKQALFQELEMIPIEDPETAPAVAPAVKKTRSRTAKKPADTPAELEKGLDLKAKDAWDQQHPGVPYPGVKNVKPTRNTTEGYSTFLGRDL